MDGSLSQDFGHVHDYKSKGGVLADAVGTGKTATSIGLVLSSEELDGGDTLVVAPSHLIPQWHAEIKKFAGPDIIQVLVGKKEYEAHATLPPPTGIRRIVLVDVDTILNEDKVWYNFRRVFTSPNGAQLKVSVEKMKKYKEAAMACVKSPRGPCSYDGWVYTGSLHHPYKPWRRVIFDEIQDLVAEGTKSQKNLLQLSHDASHVWLLSATPFPHGNSSVYANHELLGFCRLRVNVEVSQKLPEHHVFEQIKRKLYIRSPRHVADEAVVANKLVVRKNENVQQMQVEKQFYEMELKRIAEAPAESPRSDLFGILYESLREMTVHPEASAELRQQALGDKEDAVERVGQFSSVSSFAKVSLQRAKQRQKELYHEIKIAKDQLHATERSLKLAGEVKKLRDAPMTENLFQGPTSVDSDERAKKEAAKIHSFYCTCTKLNGVRCKSDKQVYFRTIGNEDFAPEFIRCGYHATQKVIQFFQSYCHPTRTVSRGNGGNVNALDFYISCTTQTCSGRKQTLAALEKELNIMVTRVSMLSGSMGANTTDREKDLLASAHGSKPAALVRFLRNVQEQGERAIVFSYWHDTLKLVQRTLTRSRLPSAFCDGHNMSKALVDFTSGAVSILLLSAQAKASGANLQCATHVILLDPAGSSAEHGAALEQQAIGRAVRMGQERLVTVTRFCVKDTLEEKLFQDVDMAASLASQRANDSNYVIAGAHKALPPKKQGCTRTETTDVQVTESVSAAERIERQFGEAKEKGTIIDLLDSDDEEDSSRIVGRLLQKAPVPSVAGVVVKKEPTPIINTKRSASGIENGQDKADSDRIPCPKRRRESGNTTKNDSYHTVSTSPPSVKDAPVQATTVSPDPKSAEVSCPKPSTSIV